MKQIYFIILMSLICINLISASVDTLKPAKLNDDYIILQVCPDATYVNLSVSNVDGNILVNKEMTLNGTQWEYHMTPVQVGRHDVTYISDGCADDDGRAVSYFEVTGSGFIGTLGFYILILVLSFGIIIFGLAYDEIPIVILGSFGLYFVGIYILFNGIDIIKDTVYTWAIGIIILMLAAYISIKASWELIVG